MPYNTSTNDIKCGIVSITENSSADITFAKDFNKTPVITATVQEAGEYNGLQITSVTISGATIAMGKVGGGSASTYNVGWIATDVENS